MATLAPNTGEPRKAATSIAPDLFERLLGIGAIVLFAAVLIACVATYLHHATDTLKLSF